ncbi:SH3 domain-containing protein [Terrilactibacillus sp. S3-3]|nr:SH3 domain-containing protein [Terrilactibacillus sp. S3-3]
MAHGANQVYVRNAPTVHGKLLTTLPKNEPLYIYGKIGSWYKIRYQKGVAYTYKTHVASGAPILWYKGYGADKVYVRDLGSGNVLGTLPPMTALNVYAKQGNWLTIGYKGGYAHTYYTHVKSGTPKVLYTGYGADKVYVRDLSSGNVLGTLPPMTALKVYAKLGNWLVIGL